MDIKPIKHTQQGIEAFMPHNDMLDGQYGDLIRQIEAEYTAAKTVLEPKVSKWQQRLKIYNNQRRDEGAVGDTLMFTVMQTIIASLYDDQLMVDFTGKNEGDEPTARNLKHLAMHDYTVMKKDELDYLWMWDTCFFGRSILYFTNFSRERDNTPLPDLQNPMLFYRDPKAVSINGDINGRNACRFFGRDIEMTKRDMEANPEFFDVQYVRPSQNTISPVAQVRQAYQDAQGLNQQSNFTEMDYKENTMYELLEWCTYFRGKKVLVTLANDRKKVVRFKEFKNQAYWPVIDRPMYPTAHDWDGTSIPDLTEDKQRMRAILANLGIKHLQADLLPMYIYNKKRFKNQGDFNFDFNKFIPATGEGSVHDAITPLQKAPLNAAVHQYIMQSLSDSAEKATASPQMQQGNLNDTRRTATELNMVDRSVGTRYSLSAKVFGWSEKRFWQQWYALYKENFKGQIDEKVLRLEGAFGAKFKKLTRENIVTEVDPDITIQSKYISEAKQEKKRMEFAQYLSLAAQVEGANIRYGVKKLGGYTLDDDELDRLFPKTIDEMVAEEENELLNNNKTVFVKAEQDHLAHLEVHARASDTPATFAHVESHKKALELMQDNPNLFPETQARERRKQQEEAETGAGRSAKDTVSKMLGGQTASAPPAGQVAPSQ